MHAQRSRDAWRSRQARRARSRGAGITLAPAVGAILMSVSTIVVALNAQLLRRVKLRP